VPSTPSKPTASDVRFAAIAAGDIEARTAALQHSLSVLEQLHGQLEFQKGGEVAQQLDRFYSIIRGKILEAQIKCSTAVLEQGMGFMADLRSAWKQVEQSSAPAVAVTRNDRGLLPLNPQAVQASSNTSSA
jgi:flagellar protein FliS